MKYKVASTLSEVLSAWCLVYKQYLAAHLIAPNNISIFTFPEYLSNNTAVIVGKKMGMLVSTISAVIDSDNGLPLDNYYKKELDQLRSENKKLIEIGLFADARRESKMANITDMMSGIARFGVYTNHLDFVVGIHPRRVNFYEKIYGFKPIGNVKNYETLETAPVVLMYCNGRDLATASLKENAGIVNDPDKFNFAHRYKFNPDNFISAKEFRASVENFIKNIWNVTTPQVA